MLDEGTLSLVTHPRGGDDAVTAKEWLKGLRKAGVEVKVPEIADYELRRELLRAGKTKSIERLDLFLGATGFIPITTEAMRLAAALWAEARNQGQPTAPDPALDGDVILAAQTRLAGEGPGTGAVVATTNPGHLTRFVPAACWNEVVPAEGTSQEEVEASE